MVGEHHVDRDHFGLRGRQPFERFGEHRAIGAHATHGAKGWVVNREDQRVRLASYWRIEAEHPVIGVIVDLRRKRRPSHDDRSASVTARIAT